MGHIKKTETSEFVQFNGGGINEYADPIALANNEFAELDDVFLNKERLFKRPGMTVWGQAFSAACRGFGEYVDEDGNKRLMVASGGQIIEAATGSNTNRQAVTIEDIHFQTQKSKLWINGATTQKKGVKTVYSDVGLAAPDTAPTSAVGAATGLTGSYAWVFTYTTDDGLESDPSPASVSLVLADQKATITPAASADTRVTGRKIYRTVVGGANYFYEGTIANNTPGATFTSSMSDAALGDMVESNHAQPDQGSISCRCNDRQARIVGNKVYLSEIGKSAAYLEYQYLEYSTLPNSGNGTGLWSLYNPNTDREDLYIFQLDSISVLLGGDPSGSLINLRVDVGCIQQDTIREYNSMIIFMNNQGRVAAIIGNKYYDISSQNIPSSLDGITDASYCRAGVIFNNFYALTARCDATKLYCNTVFVCDLRTITVVNDQAGIAKAVWVTWHINAEYILQRNDGSVLFFDNSIFRIFQLDAEAAQDKDAAGTASNIPWSVRTKNFAGGSVMWLKQPRMIGLKGLFSQNISVIPYFWADRQGGTAASWSIADLFIMGVSLMGDNISQAPTLAEVTVEPNAANTFSFKFYSLSKDQVFSLTGFQFTYKQFARGT